MDYLLTGPLRITVTNEGQRLACVFGGIGFHVERDPSGLVTLSAADTPTRQVTIRGADRDLMRLAFALTAMVAQQIPEEQPSGDED